MTVLSKMFWALASSVLSLSVVALLITTSLNALLYDAGYYAQGQARHAVGRTTEYTPDALAPINRAIVQFFRSPGLSLPSALADAGANRDVFNEREIGHMEDVRDIVRLLGRIEILAAALAVAVVAGRFLARGREAAAWVAGRALTGAVATLGAVAVLGGLALVDFGSLFLRFHLLSFDNDLWQLDPRRDNLIRFFPIGFWFDGTVTVAMRSVFTALIVAAAALWARWLVGRSRA